MSEGTKKGFLTDEQLNTLVTEVNTFIDEFKKMVQDNAKEVDDEVEKTEKQKSIFNKYAKANIESKFNFTKNDYKFSIDKFKEETKKTKTTISDYVINEIIDKVFTYSFYDAQITNYINKQDTKTAKQKIFTLFETLITNLINNNIITKDFFKDNSNTKIGRIFSILAIYSPNDKKFTELRNKLLEHLDEKDKKNVLSYGKLNGAIDNTEQNATYFLLQNPDINYTSVEQIIKNIDEDNKIENLVSLKDVLTLLGQEHIINNQEKSKKLIDLFFEVLEQDLKGSKDEVKEYFSSGISNNGKYSNFLLDYAIVYNKIQSDDIKAKFTAQFDHIITKLKEKFGEDFVIDLLSGISTKYNENEKKTEFNFLNTDLIQGETIRNKVITKINQKKETIKTGEDGKITKFEKLNKLAKDNPEEFKKEFLKLDSYDEKMAYLYYKFDFKDIVENHYKSTDYENYKNIINLISKYDSEFIVNLLINICNSQKNGQQSYKNLYSDGILENLIINKIFDTGVLQVFLNYLNESDDIEIKNKIKKIFTNYCLLDKLFNSRCSNSCDFHLDEPVKIFKLIDKLCNYEEFKNAIIYNRLFSDKDYIFMNTVTETKKEKYTYNTFEQIIDLITKSAKNADKNPYEKLVNDILPHFGGEKYSFRHKIFELASFDDIKKYLNKVKEICDGYDKEKGQTEGTSFSNLLLNNYGANILDLMNEKKESEITDEQYKTIKGILGDELYKTLVSRSKNEDAKKILTDDEKNKIEDEQKKRENLINEMVDMVQSKNIDGIKSKLSNITTEDEKFDLLHSVFKLCEIYIVYQKSESTKREPTYLNSKKYKEFETKYNNDKDDYKSKYIINNNIVMDYKNVMYTLSNLINEKQYEGLISKLCKNKIDSNTGYNLIGDALSTSPDYLNDSEDYYKNILNIISKLKKEDLIYILNQRHTNSRYYNILYSLIEGQKMSYKEYSIDYITSLINITYNKIGHDEFQKIMGNRGVNDEFDKQIKLFKNTISSLENKDENIKKLNTLEIFMNNIKQDQKPTEEIVQQMQNNTNAYLENKMGNDWHDEYKKQQNQSQNSQEQTLSKDEKQIPNNNNTQTPNKDNDDNNNNEQLNATKSIQPTKLEELNNKNKNKIPLTKIKQNINNTNDKDKKNKSSTQKDTKTNDNKSLVKVNNNSNDIFFILMFFMLMMNANSKGQNKNQFQSMMPLMMLMMFGGDMFGNNKNNTMNPMQNMFNMMPLSIMMSNTRPIVNNRQIELNNLKRTNNSFDKIMQNGINRML